MKIPNLNKHITHIRNQKIYQTWEEQKAFLSMSELSKIFNISVPQVYRVIKAETEKKSKQNNSCIITSDTVPDADTNLPDADTNFINDYNK